jgi:hypothetical protein
VQVQLEKRAKLAHAIMIDIIFIAPKENKPSQVLTSANF